jgi:CHAT domain-containing protein/tetratricopeptide (TPR) repeat protein
MKNLIYIISFFILSFNGNFSVLSQNKDYAISLYDKGNLYGRKGQLDSALIYTNKAVVLLEAIQPTDSTFLANSYQSLGIINKLLGKYNNAIDFYGYAELIYKERDENSLLAIVYSNKANIFYIQQDYIKAEDYQKQAIRILERDSIKFKRQLRNFYNNLANVFKKKSEFRKAIYFYNKSLKLKEKKDSYVSYGNLAICYQNLNNRQKAKTFYKLAIQTARESIKSTNPKLAQQLMYYAIFLGNQKNIEKSVILFDEALKIYQNNFGQKHPDISSCLNAIGEMYLQNSNLDSALLYFQKSLIALSPNFKNNNLNSNPKISEVFSQTHLLRSLKNKANALAIRANRDKSLEDYKLSLLAYENVSNLFTNIRLGYVSEESKLLLADNEFETFSNALETCFNLYNLTNNPEYIEKAFYYSESGKSSILNESMRNANALNIGGIPDSLITLEKSLEKSIWSFEEIIYEETKRKTPNENKLSYWNKYLFEEKQKYSELLVYLETNFTDYHTFKYKKAETSIVQIQHEISQDESVIEFFLTDNSLYTFLIQKNKVLLNKGKTDSAFHKNLTSVIRSASDNNFSYHGFNEFNEFQNASYRVYKNLFGAIENEIKQDNLIIIPDGILAYLPFEVLTTVNNNFQKINYKNLSYLIYQNAISYAHSANFISTIRTKKVASKNIAAFAPSYKIDSNILGNHLSTRQQYREKLFPLKGIKEEAINITDLINGDKFLGNEANETHFKKVANQYDILHLAMHTIVDDNNPMYSKMAFTQTNDSINDGFLNTYELYNIKLNSRMTVLSSCNSGSGKMQRGEGVISLARGFIYSGCPSIVMTLWSVEDKSGVKLMTNFYKSLLKGKSKAEALQDSKIEFIKKADQLKAHPYFWSGYVVIGNNDPLFYNKSNVIIGTIILGLLILLVFIIYTRRKKTKTISKI